MRFRSANVVALVAATIVATFTLAASPARADLLITVDKTTQRMTVDKDGETLFVWPVSTGAAGYDTPSGTFRPFRMEKDHFSKEWDDAPMPNSIFFTMKGHAIHGSTHKSIGRPASHGCVRLEPNNAALLFDLVKQETMAKTRVVLTGVAPTAPQVARRTAPASVEQGFPGNDITASVPALAPPADIPPAYVQPRQEQRQERRAVIGYRDTRTGEIYYYDRPRYYAPPPPPPRYFQRYGYDDRPRGLYYYGR